MQGIYWIRNKINGKRIIGSSNNIRQRWYRHKSVLRYNKHENPHLQNAWNKYGEEGFVLEVLEETNRTQKARLEMEQKYLDKWFPTGLLYNIARKAEAPLRKPPGYWDTHDGPFEGKHHTKEVRQKQSIRISGEGNPNYGKDMSGENNPFYGKQHTKEANEKNGKAHAKPYSAFYNIKTGEYIPAGQNLSELCRRRALNCDTLRNLKNGNTIQSRDGWRLANK